MSAPVEASLLYEGIGSRIREARHQAGLSQDVLGDKVGLTRPSISNLEHGRQWVPLHTLYEIALALNVELLELLPEQLPKAEYDDDIQSLVDRVTSDRGRR